MKANHESPIYVYRRLLAVASRYWFRFLLGIIGTGLYSGIDAGVVYFVKPILDNGFIDRNLTFIHWLPIILILLFLLRGVASFLSTYYLTWVGRTVVMLFRQQIFNHLLRLPASYYDQHTSGQLLSTIIYNVEQLASASTDALMILIRESFFIVGLIIVMFAINWKITMMFLIIAPVIAAIVRFSNKRLRKLSHKVQNVMGDVTHVAEESIEGYRIIRTFNGEEYERKKFAQATENNRIRELKLAITSGVSSPFVQALLGIVIAITIFIATQKSVDITAGGFVAMIGAMLTILKPMKSLTNVNIQIQRGIAAAGSIFQLLDEPQEVDRGTINLNRVQGEINFKNVDFSYSTNEKIVISNFNLQIKAGETIAFVGRSGAGKSTIISLLPRFYDCQKGEITVDGINILDIKLTDLRRQFALVSQHVILFNDTIAHNIAYGRLENVSEREIEQAAIAAHAMEFIRELPQGFATQVGEKGLRLSGGQRQRIAIARAILMDAPILILDEATSALDSESEHYIQEALQSLMRNRTTLVIAHRLSTVEKADKIVVLEQGSIVEQGNHDELLALNNYYAKLYRMQFKDNHKQDSYVSID